MDRVTFFACLWLLLAGMTVSALGQEDDYLEGDVPKWLEGYGYEDTHNDENSAAAADSQQLEGSDGTTISGAGASISRRGPQGLTGDWLGYRTALRESGITYQGRVTQFFFGVGGGINEPVLPQFQALGVGGGDTFEYTGNSRHDLIFDLEKFGGLPHGRFIFTTENVWGRWGNVSFETGALSPAVFNAAMPIDVEANGVPRVTNFLFVQPLSEKFVLTIGKTRMVGIADNNIFAGGDGSDQFLNQSLTANPLFLPQIPFSSFAVGAVMPREWGNIAVTVIDPLERSTEFMEFGDLFSTGAILFGQVQIETNFLGMPGEQHFGGMYKNADLQDLAFATNYPSYPYPPGSPGNPFLTKSESSTIFWGFDQYLRIFGESEATGDAEGWGLFGRAGLADGGTGNPNFLSWFVSGGIGGDSPLVRRRGKGDRFGIGYAFLAASPEFGLIPQALFGPRDGQVIETYYRYRLTPSIEVTPSVQWVKGILGRLTDGDDAVVAGIRLNMRL